MHISLKRLFFFSFSVLFVVCLVVNSFPVPVYANNDYPSIIYNTTEEAELIKIGTFDDSGDAAFYTYQNTGEVYLASLPFGAEITSVEFSKLEWFEAFCESGCVMSLEDALNNIIYNDDFSDPEFINDRMDFGYGALYNCITFDEGFTLPTQNVMGFAIYDYDGNYEDTIGTIVFIQISTIAEATAKTLDAGGVIINYTAANNGTIGRIGTFDDSGDAAFYTYQNTGEVYLASLPFGAEITSVEFSKLEWFEAFCESGCVMSLEDALNNIIYNDDFSDPEFINDRMDFGYGALYNCITFDEGFTLPTQNVMGFAIYDYDGNYEDTIGTIVFIQIVVNGDDAINTAELQDEVAKIWNGSGYTDNYYQSDDRWNGTKAYLKDADYPSRGFFWDTTQKVGNPLTAAQGSFTSQAAVDSALVALSGAINDLIPSKQANTTLLYEALQAKWFWTYSVYERVPTEWTSTHQGSPEWVTADSTTYASWMPYVSALDDAQEMMDTLFDADGKATEANKASLNTQIATLVAALDVSKLVNKEDYTQNYNYFLEHEATAEALLTQADPTELDQESYSSVSWGKLVDAWNALEGDLNHRFDGGSREDMDILIAFPSHLDALQKAYQGLVSDTDITVEFTYVNNFAAKYPALRSSGQDILQVDALTLVSGHTTVQDAVTAAYVQFDSVDIRGFVIPGDNNNQSDTSPVYLVYVNGKYMGNSTQTIQLHDNDRVRVVRICEPVYVTEVSSGQSSSSNLENPTLDTTYLGDSLAVIGMTAPDAPKVGDKAAFSATLTGAYGSSVGEAYNAGNITLFVSEPYSDEAEHFTHQPTTNTGVSTDATGQLEYVFSEPGWYAVAMFSVEDDTPAFTDIYNSTTAGAYSSVYAGDFAIIYVAPSEDEAKLIAQYKAEYAETAKAYYEGFHDYDFADGYYAETFQPQYEALVAHLESALSYKALKEQFEADFALLKEYGAMAIDHQGIVDALRQKLSYLPEEISALHSSHAAQVTEIQTAYAAMGAHTKTLLTQAELDRLEQIAAIDVSALPAVSAVTVQIQTVGTLPGRSGNGNPYYGYPNLTWVKTPNPDGTVDSPVWATTYDPATLSAKAGDHVFVRRYLDSTDAQYRMVWSVDGGMTWTPSTPQTLVDLGGNGSYDGYYLVEYIVPQDIADGSTVTIQLKMWSKAEYDSIGLADTKAAALTVLQSAYDAYDLTQYDDAGKAALAQALEDGLAAIEAATTNDAVTAARKAAIAAMAAVDVAAGQQTNSSYDSGTTVGRVFVTIENTTWPDMMSGTIAEGWYELGAKDSMMTVVLKVLEDNGYTWSGTGGGSSGDKDYSITYLAGITKDGQTLAEFTGGKKSGWMGTLNDWFVNEGFNMFSVANGKLENNDVIRVMYTTDKGADIGSVWGVNDTSLATLTVSAGTLSPAFDGGTTDYTLVLPEGVSSVTVKPVPVNKNYQSRIFLNSYNQDSAMFKRTDAIPVKVGDVIYVGVGEQGWPTMNSGGRPTKYTIRVATADGAVDDLDSSKVNLSNYQTYAAKLAGIDYDSLSDTGKARYDAVQARVAFYQAVVDLKTEIAALPGSVTAADKTAVDAAMEHYNALTEAHDLLTGAETNKLFKSDNTVKLLAAMDKIAATKDFAHTEANTSGEVKTALETWLNGLGLGNDVTVSVAVDAFTAASSSANGSYSATVTLSIGEGGKMASGEKSVSGKVEYVKSTDAGVKSVTANGVNAAGSGTAYSAILPYGSNVATATIVVEPADNATVSAQPATSDGGTTWTFTVTAEDGTTKQDYTLTLSVNDVITTTAQSSAYLVGNDAEPIEVTGLVEAVSTDALDLPVGASTFSVWLEVTKTAESGGEVTVSVAPKYSVDGGAAQDIPDAAMIGDATVTLPIAGTANARVLHGGEYLVATGSASGITFAARSGQYTLIPDALIATVTYHLNDGTASSVTDGQQIAYYTGDELTLPQAERSGYTLKGWYGNADGSGSAVTAISAGMPGELWAIWQSSDASATVSVGGVNATASGTVFTVSLPFGSSYPTASDITITPANGATASVPVTEDEGASWSIKVTAEDGTEKNYTLQVEIAEQTAAEKLAAAKKSIEEAGWTVSQATANDASALKTFVEGKLATMDLNVSYEVTVSGVTPAATGTKDNENGTDGSYGFTAALVLGEETATATVTGAKITATAYAAPAPTVAYKTALNAVLPYIEGTTPNPIVGSTNGEWAVFALNRGGAATEEWNNKYLTSLQTYVDNCNGKLHEKKYTEYSRVVLALTSMGVDATKFTTSTKTYDLVTPLLDKQDNGDYWAEWQGNNGTAFALLALDSHNYLDNAEGKAARAAFIASLKANQLDNGAWPISGDDTSDYDVTAAAIYALAPYYLDSAKLTALGSSVSYSELKKMVDDALAFLSGAQGADGGFGSVEADVWTIIALSALKRDADTDPDFVKNGNSLLNNMLGYFIPDVGGFKHLMDGSVNQMASEQAAYGLVAYDRYKTGKNALYDMTDVTLKSNEPESTEEADKAAAAAVDAKIAAIGTVTLESESATTAARTAYDALTDAQKALVTKLAELTVAEAKLEALKNNGSKPDKDKSQTITVTMRLIGAEKATKDVDLGKDSYLPNYVTWIATTSYTLDKGSTVYDLWTAATSAAGIRSVGADNNYVETVYAPSGYALSEFTNGPRSGWMYTINGSHPGFGLKEQGLADGDAVIWHYVNDYSYEVEDWFGDDPNYPALGDGTYWNLWLKAPDSTGGTGGGSSGSSDKKDDKKAEGTTTETTTSKDVIIADDGTEIKIEIETVTETKTNEDGSVTESVTETTTTTSTAPDGSVIQAEKVIATENTTNSVENDDGSVTETVGAKETVTETVKSDDGSSTVTVKETGSSTETTSKTNSDGSTTATAVTTTTEKTSETVTAADGSKTTVTTETTETKTLETTVGTDGKTTGSGSVNATTTITNADGSKSTAVTEGTIVVDTDAKGTVSEVTTATTTTTAANGAVTQETTITTDSVTTDGTTGKTVEDTQGNTLSAEATVSEKAMETAQKTGDPIQIPVTMNPASGAAVNLRFSFLEEIEQIVSKMFEVEVQVKWNSPGLVAYQRFPGGAQKLSKDCRRGSVIVRVPGNCELVIADNTKTFTDVDTASWYGDSVTFVTAREIFNGNGDGTFNPGGNMNRAMAAQIIYNLDYNATAGNSSVFSDVSAEDWYNAAVGWAAGQGIINGVGDNRYAPKADITRQDLIKILYYYARQAGYDVSAGSDVDLASYADGADVSDYAQAPMRWAIASGIIGGYTDGTLKPRNTATRAEVAAIMQRMIENALK